MEIAINLAYVLVLVALAVIVISSIELWRFKANAAYVTELPQDSIMINPKTLNLRWPIYIYNSARVKHADLKLDPSYTEDTYTKVDIPVHIGARIVNPIRDMLKSFVQLPKTRQPINLLYTALNKSDVVVSNVNPIIGADRPKYRMLISKHDADNCEVTIDEKLYFTINRKKQAKTDADK